MYVRNGGILLGLMACRQFVCDTLYAGNSHTRDGSRSPWPKRASRVRVDACAYRLCENLSSEKDSSDPCLRMTTGAEQLRCAGLGSQGKAADHRQPGCPRECRKACSGRRPGVKPSQQAWSLRRCQSHSCHHEATSTPADIGMGDVVAARVQRLMFEISI
jgi:hypothetical protein